MLKITLQIKFDKRWIRLVSFSQRGFCVIKTCIHCGKLYQSFYHHEKCIWYQPNINQLKTSFFKFTWQVTTSVSIYSLPWEEWINLAATLKLHSPNHLGIIDIEAHLTHCTWFAKHKSQNKSSVFILINNYFT